MKKWENPEISMMGINVTKEGEELPVRNPNDKAKLDFPWICLLCGHIIPANVQHTHFDCPGSDDNEDDMDNVIPLS